MPALFSAVIGKLHVTPVDTGPGSVTNTFVVRFPDRLANDCAALRKAIADVSAKYA
jgi:hypothetical protein